MNIQLERKYPFIYTLTFDTQYELCMSLVRIQEYYESPEFKGQTFTLEEYQDWWVKSQKTKCFDYPTRWAGFNIPGDVFVDWVNDFSAEADIREKEREVLNVILGESQPISSLKGCYIIASYASAPDYKMIIDHELAHAFYNLHPEYRKSVSNLIVNFSEKKKKKAYDHFRKMGYDSSVFEDEFHAYSSTGSPKDKLPKILKVKKDFKKNFENYKKTLTNIEF